MEAPSRAPQLSRQVLDILCLLRTLGTLGKGMGVRTLDAGRCSQCEARRLQHEGQNTAYLSCFSGCRPGNGGCQVEATHGSRYTTLIVATLIKPSACPVESVNHPCVCASFLERVTTNLSVTMCTAWLRRNWPLAARSELSITLLLIDRECDCPGSGAHRRARWVDLYSEL